MPDQYLRDRHAGPSDFGRQCQFSAVAGPRLDVDRKSRLSVVAGLGLEPTAGLAGLVILVVCGPRNQRYLHPDILGTGMFHCAEIEDLREAAVKAPAQSPAVCAADQKRPGQETSPEHLVEGQPILDLTSPTASG